MYILTSFWANLIKTPIVLPAKIEMSINRIAKKFVDINKNNKRTLVLLIEFTICAI